jgi:hypothetical protein
MPSAVWALLRSLLADGPVCLCSKKKRQGCTFKERYSTIGSSFPSLIVVFPRLAALEYLPDQSKWAGPLAVSCKFMFRGPARTCFFYVSIFILFFKLNKNINSKIVKNLKFEQFFKSKHILKSEQFLKF